MHETRDEFQRAAQQARSASNRQLQSCRNKCCVVEVTETGMSHMSFSDVPLLAAFRSKAKEEEALRCLKELGDVVLAFFKVTLKAPSEPATDLRANHYPAIQVATYDPH